MFNTSKNAEILLPEWIAQCNETQERWFMFLDKLEVKMGEFCEAAIPELENLYINDKDQFKRTYYKLLSGVKGQLNQIRNKAADAYEEKVNGLYDDVKSQVSVMSPHYNLLSDFRTNCSERYHRQLDKKYQNWNDQLDATKKEDFEIEYQQIIAEYESIKNSFACKQCAGALSIDKIFFISTVITCPFCQTQNTFEPSSQARNLEHLGRQLAEQRTKPLLNDYMLAHGKEREIYFKMHELGLKRFTNPEQAAANKKQLDDMEAQRQQSIKDAPAFYETYLRAMFNEWNKIVPDLATQNEKFYQRQLDDFRKQNN